MPTRPIKITGSNTSDGSLVLPNRGHTPADAGDTILWQIGNRSGVRSIQSIQEKRGSTDIFSAPPRRHGSNWQGDINPAAPALARYIYSITWLADDGSGPHIHDPIISIRPRTTSKVLLTVALLAFTVAVGIYTYKFLHKKYSKK